MISADKLSWKTKSIYHEQVTAHIISNKKLPEGYDLQIVESGDAKTVEIDLPPRAKIPVHIDLKGEHSITVDWMTGTMKITEKLPLGTSITQAKRRAKVWFDRIKSERFSAE